MNNRGYNRRRRHLRVTGRFYAFLTMLVIAIVFICVLVTRSGRGRPDNAQTPSIAPMAVTTPVVVSAPTPVAEVASASTPVPAAPGTAFSATDDDTVVGEYDADAEDNYELISEEDKVKIDSLSVTQGLNSDWRNILLLGTDSRNVKKVTRTDTIMIASINAKTGRIKLASIMRDLVVSAPKKGGGTREVKINALVNIGGTDLLMKTINELFGMNITEYALVNFNSFQKVVDILGGVDMDITEAEMKQINISLGEMAKAAGYDQDYYLANRDNLSLKVYGPQTHLTGLQALGYARIRHVGSGDYQRTERQRNMLDSIIKKVKNDASLGQIMQLGTSMWGEITTNIDFGSAIGLATTVLKNGAVKLDQSWRIPGSSTSFKSENRKSCGSALYDCDFEANKQLLYKFIYET